MAATFFSISFSEKIIKSFCGCFFASKALWTFVKSAVLRQWNRIYYRFFLLSSKQPDVIFHHGSSQDLPTLLVKDQPCSTSIEQMLLLSAFLNSPAIIGVLVPTFCIQV